MIETFETIRTVLAVRAYQSTPVADDVVREIVEAGRLTASGMNSQPWHFIVVQDPERLRQLAEIATTGRYLAQAPLAIVVVMNQSRLALADTSRAIQSMVLTAWSHGVGSNWVGFNNLAEAKTLLAIPEAMEVLAILPFGYPAKSIGKGQKERKPLAEVASRERFDQPFA